MGRNGIGCSIFLYLCLIGRLAGRLVRPVPPGTPNYFRTEKSAIRRIAEKFSGRPFYIIWATLRPFASKLAWRSACTIFAKSGDLLPSANPPRTNEVCPTCGLRSVSIAASGNGCGDFLKVAVPTREGNDQSVIFYKRRQPLWKISPSARAFFSTSFYPKRKWRKSRTRRRKT